MVLAPYSLRISDLCSRMKRQLLECGEKYGAAPARDMERYLSSLSGVGVLTALDLSAVILDLEFGQKKA